MEPPTVNSRFSAKLLFQYRVGRDAAASKFRTVEERIVTLREKTAKSALAKVKAIGRESESRFTNDDGADVYIEFIGVVDLMELGLECEPHDVWYEIRTMLQPLERRRSILPAEEDLSAFRAEKLRVRGAATRS
jgi:hypothetical protein